MSTATPLRVSGRWILGADGNRVKLAGANWAGGHEDAMVVSGLDYRRREDIAAQVAAWGFNSVRLTFCVRMLSYNAAADPALLTANPDLTGQTPWQVYQAVARALTDAGVMVIPNCHMLYGGWSDGEDGNQGLWYNDNWPVSRFTAAWQAVAGAFADDPLVIGYDIKNEPRPAVVGGLRRIPGWGTGGSAADFRLMYSQTADLIHAADPGALMFCEGLDYASDLTAAGAHPVTPAVPGKVAYSMHDYPGYHPAGESRAAYLADMRARGGYLMDSGKAPVWLGEFSAGNESPSSLGLMPGGAAMNEAAAGAWFQDLLAWLRATDTDYCWWQLGGTHSRATIPVTNVLQYNQGDRCTGGLFSQSWNGPSNPDLLAILQSLQAPRLGPGTG